MGYASAMGWILFLLILAVTAILLRSARKWVHYRG
jgi:multiple sugar transport system permease protein